MGYDITSLVIETKSKGVADAAKNLSELSKGADKAQKSVDALEAAMRKIDATNKLVSASADSYMVKLREQAALMQGMSSNTRIAAVGTQSLASAMTLLSTSLNLMNQNLQQAEVHQRRHNNSMRDAHALARGLSGSLGALWMTYSSFTGMAVGVAIGVSLKGIVSVGKDVEHTLEGIRVRGNETTESIDNMRKSVMDLGQGVYGPQEVAKAFETLVLAGLKADQAISSISAALNLATVGGVSIEKAATTLVSVGTAIGFTAEGFGRVGDVIAKTAALSMSSVETLSQAFKSASSVNRLYGISLEDIGTSLGVLSNLGIQGSAAGTALKNFYKELAAESDKVGSTLHKMKLSQAAFKDADGNFKPLLEVVTLLDEGLNRLSKGESKLAQGRLSNERGQRLMTQLLGEYNTKLGDSDNALARFRRNVENSYGFAAKGAVQMALTAKSQVDSMFNTLKTSFAETFTSIQPEVIAFSSRMKAVFGSKDFKDAIAELARWFAKLAMAIAENIPLLAKLAVGLIAVKAAMIGASVWQAAAAGIASIGTAITGLAAGTLTLAAALPALAVVLGVVAVAWTAYNLAKGEDLQKQAKDAQAYASGYISGLTKEAENLDKVNAKMREKKSLLDANAEVERDESRQKMIGLDQKAIAEAEKNLYEVTSKFSFNRTKQLQDQKDAQSALNKARENAANNTKLAAAAEATLFAKAKENADLAKANADKSRDTGDRTPTATLGGKTDTKAINDAYHEAIKLQEGYLTAASHAQAAYDKQQQSLFKAGTISKLEMIENISIAQIAASMKTVNALQVQEDLANKRKDGKSDAQGFHNKRLQEITDQAARADQVALDSDVYIKDVRQASAKLEIKELEAKGQWVAAEQKRYEGDTKAMYDEVAKAAEKYGDKFPALIVYLKQLKETQDAAMDTAKVKEAYVEFERLNTQTSALFKGLVAQNEDGGMASLFNAAMNASEKFRTIELPALQKAYEDLRVAADASSNPADKKKANSALLEMQGQSNHMKTMWASVGESISKSLSSAFGKGGKALGGLLKLTKDYSKLEGKSALERISAYGDMAGAAKGFFKENSAGYKVMEGAERAFRVYEMSQMIASHAIKSGLLEAFTGLFTTAKVAETTAEQATVVPTVLAEGVKQEALATTALAGAVAVPFPGNLVAFGIVVAMLAAIGIAGKSGGAPSVSMDSVAGMKANTGTGGVLGDPSAQSLSIANSLESLEKMAKPELVFTSEMVRLLRSINTSLAGATSSLLSSGFDAFGSSFQGTASKSGGGIAGMLFGSSSTSTSLADLGLIFGKAITRQVATIFGHKVMGTAIIGQTIAEAMKGVDLRKYVVTRTDSSSSSFLGFGSSSSTTYSTAMSAVDKKVSKAMTDAVNQMYSVVKGASSQLGVGGSQLDVLNNMPTGLGKVSLKGKTGKEIEELLNAVFSKMGDAMALKLLPGLSELQKSGEGALETLTRVANQLYMVNNWLEKTGRSLYELSLDGAAAADALATAFGGQEKMEDITSKYYDTFYSESEKVANSTRMLTKAFAAIGYALPSSNAELRNWIDTVDISTDTGRNSYVQMMSLSEAFGELTDSMKDATNSIEEEIRRIRGLLNQNSLESFTSSQGSFAIATAQARAGDSSALALLPELSQAMLGLAETNASSLIELQSIRAATAQSLGQTLNSTNGGRYQLPSFAVGTDFVPYDMVAQIHKGEKIVPAAYNNNDGAMLAEMQAMRQEIAQLRAESSAQQTSIAISSGKTAKILTRNDTGSGLYTTNTAPV
jgi:TP901 family phage tail tape measure protein